MNIPDFALERFFARWEFDAPYLLCTSDVQGWRMADVLALADDEAREMWDGLALGYTEAAGHPRLREAIAARYHGVSPDDVLVFSGAEEAIFAFFHVLCGPGDRVLAVAPAYQSLHEVARAAGASVDPLPLRHEDGWRLDVDQLHRTLERPTRAVVLNYPHNPTGALLGEADFRAAVAVAEDAGARVFSDEVYRGLERSPDDRLPAAVEFSARAVSLGVMSKAYAMPGLRIGWIACRDREMLGRLAAFKDYLTICSSAPAEILSVIALRAADVVLDRSRRICADNLAVLEPFFARWEGVLEWVPPRAGSTAFPRFAPSLKIDVDALADDLRERTGVLIAPGSLFGDRGTHWRLGFGRTNLPDAIERFEGYLAARFGPR